MTPDPMHGAETLLDAHALITGDRQGAYGHPADDYAKVVDIFRGLTGIDLTREEALLFMVSVKMARLRTNLEWGDFHRDSLVDAAGYLGCLAMVVERREVEREEARRRADANEVGLSVEEWESMKAAIRREAGR